MNLHKALISLCGTENTEKGKLAQKVTNDIYLPVGGYLTFEDDKVRLNIVENDKEVQRVYYAWGGRKSPLTDTNWKVHY